MLRILALVAALLPWSLAHAQAYRVGRGVQITPASSAPTKDASNGLLWIDSTASNVLKYKNPAGSTITLGAGGGGGTLSSTYDGSNSANNIITVTSSGDAVVIRDASTPIGSLDIFHVMDNAGTTKFLQVGPGLVGMRGQATQIIPAAVTTGNPGPALQITAPASTGLTAATPYYWLKIAAAGVTQFTGGGTWTSPQAHVEIDSGTLSATSATTIPDAATMYLFNAPVPGTNMTFTNRWNLYVRSGASLFQRDFAGPTNPGVRIESRAAASLGSQQASPGFELCGQGWGTGGSASSQVCISQVTNPIQGNTPTSTLDFYANQNGGAYGSTLCTIGTAQSSSNQPFVVQPASIAAGTSTAFKVTGAANTGLTASTEVPDVDLTLNRTVQWATGALTAQRFVVVRQPTIGFVGASTVTNAAALALVGPPLAGTNATLTNSWTIWSQSGASRIQRDSLGTTQTIGVLLDNSTAASNGAQQVSPSLVFSGNGYHSGGTPGSASVRYALQATPYQNSGSASTGALVAYESINGGGWTQTEINGSGYFGNSDQSALGAASTSSTTYVDVGNGSSTGFASWTAPVARVTKVYTLHVSIHSYMSAVGSTNVTQFQVLQDGSTIAGHPTNINRLTTLGANVYGVTEFTVPVTLTAGTAHVFKLQWKVGDGSAVANVTSGVGQLQFYITG